MTQPHSDTCWSDVETWSRDRIESFQLEALQRQLAYVGQNSAYFRREWAALGFEPADVSDLGDLRKLPMIRKSDYVASIAEDTPYSSMLAAPLEDVQRVHFSSGTTSSPTPVCWTRHDLDRWADLYARASYSQGVRPHYVYQVLFGYPWFVGGLGVTASCERIGCTVLPGGSGETERQISVMHDFGTTAVSGTPSFMLHLAETAEKMGRPLSDSAVTRIQVGGEPGAGIPRPARNRAEVGREGLRRLRIARVPAHRLGVRAPAGRAPGRGLRVRRGRRRRDRRSGPGRHPRSPCADAPGQAGHAVRAVVDWRRRGARQHALQLRAHAQPYPGRRAGRGDDMLVVKGVNLFPSSVENIVRRMDGVTGEYRIVLDRDVTNADTGYLTGIKIRLEVAPGQEDRITRELASAVRAELTVRTIVDCVPVGALERSTHKATRVVRED